MKVHPLAVPESLDFLHMQNQSLTWPGREGRFPQRKHLIKWVERVGKIKLVMENRRNIVEMSSISALACKMPS